MFAENIIIGISLVLSGALIIALCFPLLHDRIKPNALYGVRIAKSFESEANWYKLNRYGARQMMLWSTAIVAAGCLALFVPLKGNEILLAIVAVSPVLFVLIPLLQIFRYSKTL